MTRYESCVGAPMILTVKRPRSDVPGFVYFRVLIFIQYDFRFLKLQNEGNPTVIALSSEVCELRAILKYVRIEKCQNLFPEKVLSNEV